MKRVFPNKKESSDCNKPGVKPTTPAVPAIRVERISIGDSSEMVEYELTPMGILQLPRSPVTNEPVTIAILHNSTNAALLKQPNFLKKPFAFPPASSSEWPFVIIDTPGMGKGMFAREEIPPGKLILNERPLLVAPIVHPYMFGMMILHASEVPQLLINQLDAEAQEKIYHLDNCKDISAPAAKAIFDTNALGIGTFPGPFKGQHGGLFIVLSRINHSCRPNAYYTFDLDTFSMRLLPTRLIQKGEQIFIAYTPTTLAPRKVRQQFLTQYGFTCTCPNCQLPDTESHKSDMRREFLFAANEKLLARARPPSKSLTEFQTHWQHLSREKGAKTSRMIVDALDEENLVGDQSELALWHMMILALDCCEVRDRRGAVMWGKRWLWTVRMRGLLDAKDDLEGAGVRGREIEGIVKEMKDLVRRPESLKIWGPRMVKGKKGNGDKKVGYGMGVVRFVGFVVCLCLYYVLW